MTAVVTAAPIDVVTLVMSRAQAPAVTTAASVRLGKPGAILARHMANKTASLDRHARFALYTVRDASLDDARSASSKRWRFGGLVTTVNKIFLVANIALFVAFDWLFLKQAIPLHPSAGWEYKDLVSVLLSVVTIVLAFIGLVVALAAVWGWQTISQGAAREATKASSERTDVHLQSDDFKGKLRLLILEQLENINKTKVQDGVVLESAQDVEQAAPVADEEWKD